MTQEVRLSTTDWVREQTEQILEQGTTDGVQVLDRRIVLFTVIGAKSGLKRYVPCAWNPAGGMRWSAPSEEPPSTRPGITT